MALLRLLTIIILTLCLVFLSEIAYSQAPQGSHDFITPQRIRLGAFGALVPLSGKYKLIGEKALKGALIASQSVSPGVSYEIVVKDIGENGKFLNSAASNLAARPNISFIVGPVPSKYTANSNVKTIAEYTPVITFPLSEDESYGGRNIVKFYYSLEDQVKVLAEYSIRQLGVRTFAILHPNSSLGSSMKEEFVETVNKYGGRVTYSGSYSYGFTDISDDVKWIATNMPDAIFIPDGAAASAEVILQLMSRNEVRDVLFIGPGTWNSPVFLGLVGKKFDGFVYRAIFTDFFFYGGFEWEQFEKSYKTRFDQSPGTFEFQVYEALRFILSGVPGNEINKASVKEFLNAGKFSPDYNIKRDKHGSLSVSPKFRILAISEGALIDVITVGGIGD